MLVGPRGAELDAGCCSNSLTPEPSDCEDDGTPGLVDATEGPHAAAGLGDATGEPEADVAGGVGGVCGDGSASWAIPGEGTVGCGTGADCGRPSGMRARGGGDVPGPCLHLLDWLLQRLC